MREGRNCTHTESARSQPIQLLFRLTNISKSYSDGRKGRLEVLDGINLCIIKGVITGIVGVSGCGKSTLMHIIGTTDRPDDGEVSFEGIPLQHDNESQTDMFRMKDVAWVFQDLNLFSHLNVLENTMLPLNLRGVRMYLARKIALNSLASVGIAEKRRKKIYTLSGGERQRVAIARALASGAKVILADEPTGSLDSYNTKKIMELLRNINRKKGISVILITHEKRIAKGYCDYIIDLEGVKKNPPRTVFYGVPAREYTDGKKASPRPTKPAGMDDKIIPQSRPQGIDADGKERGRQAVVPIHGLSAIVSRPFRKLLFVLKGGDK